MTDIATALSPHIHQIFQDHAMVLHPSMLRDSGNGLTKEWQYAAARPKFDTKQIPHFPEAKTPEAFASWIENYGKLLVTDKKARAAKDASGNYLVVRKVGLNDYMNEAKRAYGALHALYTTPTKVWKWMVLATAPRYFVNNVVGNGLMYAMAANPVSTTRAMYNTISEIHGEHVAAKSMTDVEKAQRLITGNAIHRMYIAATMGFGREATRDLVLHKKFKNKHLAKAIAVAEGGLFGVTHHVSDTIPRTALIHMYSRQTPIYQAAFKDAVLRGMDHKLAHEHAIETSARDTATHQWVVHNVNNVLGQYHHFNQVERGIKAFVPFYSWDRAIMRHAWHLSTERPLAAQGLTQLGQQGATQSKQLLGQIPSFMVGDIPLSSIGLGGKHGGVLGWMLGDTQHGNRKKVLSTAGVNPYATVPDVVNSIASLVKGNPHPGEVLASQINPLITGAIQHYTGQSLLSGRKLPQHGGLIQDVASNTAESTPLVSLALTALHGRAIPKMNKQTHTQTPLLYRGDERQKVLALLGVPIKEYSPTTAAKLSKTEKGIKSPKSRRKTYNPAISKSLFPSPKKKSYRSRVRKPAKPHVGHGSSVKRYLPQPLPGVHLSRIHKVHKGNILPATHIKGLPSIKKL